MYDPINSLSLVWHFVTFRVHQHGDFSDIFQPSVNIFAICQVSFLRVCIERKDGRLF